MPPAEKTFRVFVSSTFSDLKAERNALQSFVFPRLRQLCKQAGARFQAVDLRWGVSQEASLDQQAMDICLGEIERCQRISPRPNFILLLGNRYGWMPPPAHIAHSDFKALQKQLSRDDRDFLKQWYTLDENAQPPEWRLNPRQAGGDYESYDDWQPVEMRLQKTLSGAAQALGMPEEARLAYSASATHQEIQSGALGKKTPPRHVFCFFRQIEDLPGRFSMADYLALLEARLAGRFPGGLASDGQALVDALRALGPEAAAGDVANHLEAALENTPEATDEEDLLQFMQAVLSDVTARDFINLDPDTWQVDADAAGRLTALKTRLQKVFSRNSFTVRAGWQGGQMPADGEAYQPISLDHIGRLPEKLEDCLPLLAASAQPQNLCEAVFRALGRVIQDEIAHPHPVVVPALPGARMPDHPALDAEGQAHRLFAQARLAHFVGREARLKQIADYLVKGRARPRMLALTGPGGTGKTSLLAKALQDAHTAHPQAQIVYRFIGATPGSADVRLLLQSLCQEIARRYGQSGGEIPVSYQDLVPAFARQLALASAEKPLILFLDSLDQLLKTNNAHNLSWLPVNLPQNVALVVSCRDETGAAQNLPDKSPLFVALGGLARKEGRDLLRQWLDAAGRTLDRKQEQAVLDQFEASDGNPLYLKLAFEEARLWTSTQPQEALAAGVPEIIQNNTLARLMHEGNHGEVLVSHALGYLAAARDGLAEDELLDLLSRDRDVYAWFFRGTYHLPADLVALAVDYLQAHPEAARDVPNRDQLDAERLALAWLRRDRTPPDPVDAFLQDVLPRPDGPRLPVVLWSRLSFDLEPYLTRRSVDGNALMTFYHRELGEAAESLFLKDAAQRYHARLADYFQSRADPGKSGAWDGGDTHALSELPYQLIKAGLRDRAFKLLTDFTFLEHKAAEVGITRQPGSDGKETVHSDGVYQLQQDYELALAELYGEGADGAGRAPLILTARHVHGSLSVICPVCHKMTHVREEQLGQVIACPQKDCRTLLKLNTFTLKVS